jgi:predicted ABC-type transport system involved in lysophospholipase L1 biosynthesis ATPase subunit
MDSGADRGGGTPGSHVIRVVDLKKTYGEDESAVHALQGVSFEIGAGELARSWAFRRGRST